MGQLIALVASLIFLTAVIRLIVFIVRQSGKDSYYPGSRGRRSGTDVFLTENPTTLLHSQDLGSHPGSSVDSSHHGHHHGHSHDSGSSISSGSDGGGFHGGFDGGGHSGGHH